MAPEMLLKEWQGPPVDYFSIGIIAHELMLKRRPWKDNDREIYKDNLFKFHYALRKADTPENWGHEASDFINKCLKRKLD